MTLKELKKQIQDLNIAYNVKYKVSKSRQSVYISDSNGCYVIITNCVPYCLYVSDTNFERLLDDNLRHNLLKAAYEFAQTPIDLRNLSPRFYVSSKLTPKVDEKFLFKFGGSINHLAWGIKDGGGTEFTQKEIDYICDKFHTNLSDFNIEEVKE